MSTEGTNRQVSTEACDQTNPATVGRFVGDELYYDIGDERISDEDLRKWVRDHFPEDSQWRDTSGGIVAYHTRAYANRRQAVADFMRALKW